jgi:hypothetical protein
MEKHLKDKQYYIDLYDRYTVEHCRRAEKRWKDDDKELPPIEGEELTKEQQDRMKGTLMEWWMHFEKGERYLQKDSRILEWMESDRKKDELYESAQAPEGIRCLTCRSLMKSTYKDLWSLHDKEDRVLFMYDCPNNCLPRRAFFSDGEEWRIKPNLCPNCNTRLDQEEINSEEKSITNWTCPKCSYTKTDELVWTHKKDELPDENFAADRDRFCISDEEGKKFQDEKWSMKQAAEMMEKWKKKDEALAKKLEENPNGFHLDGVGYTCFICGGHTPEGDNWYDQYGIKCLVCQKAIDNGEIPASLAKEKDSWYSKYDIESRFNIKAPTLRKWVKDGILKVRTVSRFSNGVHTELFLIEDNKDTLPPKKLTESRSVTEMKDGKKWYTSAKWYQFGDPFITLKGYKIMDHLRVIPPEEVKAREEAEKKKWEEKRARRELKREQRNKSLKKLK